MGFLGKLFGHTGDKQPFEMIVTYSDGSGGYHTFWAKDDQEAIELGAYWFVGKDAPMVSATIRRVTTGPKLVA
jgi:hypothetical protein